jgi:hypothetical protein
MTKSKKSSRKRMDGRNRGHQSQMPGYCLALDPKTAETVVKRNRAARRRAVATLLRRKDNHDGMAKARGERRKRIQHLRRMED